jgi:hypothetical protein
MRYFLTGFLFCLIQQLFHAQETNTLSFSQLVPQNSEVGIYTKWELGINLPQIYEDQVFQFLNER